MRYNNKVGDVHYPSINNEPIQVCSLRKASLDSKIDITQSDLFLKILKTSVYARESSRKFVEIRAILQNQQRQEIGQVKNQNEF